MLIDRFARRAVSTPAAARATVVASSCVRRQPLAGAAAIVTVSVLTAAPALADTQASSLTLHTVRAPQSVDAVCLDDACTTLQLTVTSTATGNLADRTTRSTSQEETVA